MTVSVLPDIEMINISEVHINPDNPRIIKDEKYLKLLESIKNFPQMLYIRPIVIDTHNMILGGNQRYEVCKELKYSEIPIIRAINLTEEQYREFIIKDNVSSGGWDFDRLIKDWDIDILKSYNLDLDEFDLDQFKVSDNQDQQSIEDINKNNSKLENVFNIEISCHCEEDQEKLYNEMIERGYECRLLTL